MDAEQKPERKKPPGRVAGVDYGTVRIGIAISDANRKFAGPYENYTRRNDKLDAERFRQLAVQERVALFVVGLPIHCDGGESQKSVEAREFGEWLHKETGVEVRYFDERFTSRHAERILMEANLTKKQRKKRLDKLAAQIMLSAFLESDGQSEEAAGLDD